MTATGTMTVGCVIPTHDRPGMLREALASVLAQVLPEGVRLDVVIVDDTASPATRSLVEELAGPAGPRLRVLDRRDGPKGASGSRNAGADAVVGDVLAFLDDDDIWQPDHLRRALDALATSRDGMAISWMDAFGTGPRKPVTRMRPDLTAREVVVSNPGCCGSNLLVTRSAFVAIGGFDPDLPVANDKDFLVRYLASGRTYVVVPAATVLYRQHDGPQLTKSTPQRAAGIEQYIRKHADLLAPRDVAVLRRTVDVIRFRNARGLVARASALTGVVLQSARSRLGASSARRPTGRRA